MMDFAQGTVWDVNSPAGAGNIAAGENGTEVEMKNSFR